MVPAGAIVVTVAFLIASQWPFKALPSKLGKDPLFIANALEAFLPFSWMKDITLSPISRAS
jgi:hypothetical protein